MAVTVGYHGIRLTYSRPSDATLPTPKCSSVLTSSCGGRLSSQRPEARFDLPTPSLQEGRQRELLAESRQRLVRREARAVRGNLEQDAVRLPEVEAPELVAVYRPLEGSRRFCSRSAHAP